MVFQQPLLFPHMTVMENVAFGLKMQGVKKKERGEKALHMLASVALEGFGERYPYELSGGQQQRVSLARAIVSNPRLLLMDEPFSALDPGLREEMRNLLKQIQHQYRVTVIFVTHDREEAFLLAHRMGVMKDGKILQVGKPQELYENPADQDVALFLGAQNVLPGEWSGNSFISADMRVEMMDAAKPSNKRGWLMIRPEILKLARETTDHNPIDGASGIESKYVRRLQGVVRESAFRQGFHFLQVEVGKQLLNVARIYEMDQNPSNGESVALQFDIRQTRFIPASESGAGTAEEREQC